MSNTLILIRADSNNKIMNALADIERHANLKVLGNPKLIDKKLADKTAEKILKSPIKDKSRICALVRVEADATLAITRIRKIHPPAHLIVISNEYKEYTMLEEKFDILPKFKGFYSHKKK